MKIESHLERIKESIQVVEESIEKGLQERQRTIGFHISTASVDLLEILLHKHNLIDPGFIIKHEWLKSKNSIAEKLAFEFPKKQEILDLIIAIEEKRNILCYGTPQKIEVLQNIVDKFNKLKIIFEEEGVDVK